MKKIVSKKILKALEKARKAKARKRKKELREKREIFLKPYYSEITGKRYKTEAGMKRAEIKKLIDLGTDFIPKIVLDAEATLPRSWSSLGYKKNIWPHSSGIMRKIFYDIQGNDWDTLYDGTIKEAYRRYNLDKLYGGHSLRNFITEIMGVADTDEYVLDDDEIEVDFS